jgi:arylsulfatase A-like enzyme
MGESNEHGQEGDVPIVRGSFLDREERERGIVERCGEGMVRRSREVFLLSAVLGGLLSGEFARGAERAPNIVLIYADDLGWGDVGFNGRTEWATPNLDRLGARGTIFKRFYTAAVVCAPSRAAMLTGKSTIHCGVSRNDGDLPAAEVTIAEALKARGYTTALFGKWHHGKPVSTAENGALGYVHPMDQGFDEFFGFTDAVHAWEKFPRELWDGRALRPVSGYADDQFTERALDFLRRNRDRPFFLYLPLISAHFHIQAPEEEIARHRGKLPEADPSRPLNATYAAMVTRLDREVGQVVDAVEELGLSGQTLIVFASDHGATFEQGNQGTSNALDSNRPFRGQKRTLWEGGVRVPALACWPGHIPSGVVSEGIVQTIDLLPTFLAVAGTAPEASWKVDGVNLLPAWTGQAPYPDRALFWEWRSEGIHQLAALRGNLKLVITQGGKPEVFDVVTDPAERRNITAERPGDARRLQDELKAWLGTERVLTPEAPRPRSEASPELKKGPTQ